MRWRDGEKTYCQYRDGEKDYKSSQPVFNWNFVSILPVIFIPLSLIHHKIKWRRLQKEDFVSLIIQAKIVW